MSTHTASISWALAGDSFDYRDYSRNHDWNFGHGVQVAASAAPGFLGDAERVDPEQAYVAAIASCHMLTFLAIASRKRIEVLEYEDEAIGWLEEDEGGRLAITRVELHPRIVFASGPDISPTMLEKLHAMSHRECFIARSVKTAISVCES